MSSRLARKGRKQSAREARSKHDEELGQARRKRDEALRESSAELAKDNAAARDAAAKRRKAIYDTYDEARNEIVKRAASEEGR